MKHMRAAMLDPLSTEQPESCRGVVEAAMLKLINAAVKMGWSESEVTMALADAAEDQVMRLARRQLVQ